MQWREHKGVRWLEAELPGAVAAFTTRLGGASTVPYESLNLGLLSGDNIAAVRENRRRLGAAVGRDGAGFLIGYQVHGAEIVERGESPRPNPWLEPASAPPSSDGQATANAELTLLVQVADCFPVALAGERGVAMLHCGWRGLAAGIVAAGVERVGASAAAIGPGIGPCCFEVGPEVKAEFAHLGDDLVAGPTLDLAEIARRQLAAAGVREVGTAELCTSCEAELFFSHRRDRGETGRQAGLVWIDSDG
jgi:YfiH family protein